MADANDPRLGGQTLESRAVYQSPKGEKSFCTRSLPCDYPPLLPDHLAGRDVTRTLHTPPATYDLKTAVWPAVHLGVGAEDDRLSRVHLLVVRDGGEVWAVDTASTNGTTADGTPLRQQRLGARAELLLGKTVTCRWIAGA